MFISTWGLWTIFVIIWFSLIYILGKEQGNYDFMSPLIRIIIFLLGVIFILVFK